MKDHEGSAWVRRDNSLWLADDDGRRLYELDADTGALRRTIGRTALEGVPRFRGRARAGSWRTRDLESLAYHARSDTLYAFSGSCCNPSIRPTAFRLTRQSGRLELDTYQPLRRGSDNTAAAWNPDDGRIYTANKGTIRTYSYTRNRFGKRFHIPGLDDALGMDFSGDGHDLFVARYEQKLSRVDWAEKELVPGWTFDLEPFKVRDARAVELVRGRLFVSDGYDARPRAPALRHAVFVFDIVR